MNISNRRKKIYKYKRVEKDGHVAYICPPASSEAKELKDFWYKKVNDYKE